MSKRAYGTSSGRAQRHHHLLGFDAGDLGDTGRHIEVQRRPAAERGDGPQAWVGVDGDGVLDRRQQRHVEVAVGVGPAVGDVDVVLGGPVLDRGQLALAPDEVTGDGAVVVAVGLAVPGGDHVVESETVGERLHQVVGRRGGHDDLAAGVVVLGDDREGEGNDLVDEGVGGDLAGLAGLGALPARWRPGPSAGPAASTADSRR